VPITEAQRELRKSHIGGSDVGSVLGVNPYNTAYDVWLEKTGKVTDWEPNEAADIGSLMEPGIILWAEDVLGPLIRNQYRSCPELHLGTHADAIMRDDDDTPVEVKTSGITGRTDEGYGEEGTDEVPLHVIVQCHAHIIVAKGNPLHCPVPTVLGGRGRVMFDVKRSDDLVEIIGNACIEFWRCVETDTPPEGSIGSLKTLKRVIRVPNKVHPVSAAAVGRKVRLAKAIGKAKKRLEGYDAAILTEMGDAEGGDYGDDKKIVTYYEATRSGYTVAPKTYRTLRVQNKPKET